MSYQDILSLIGGLCLFLFGMQVMGSALEKRAGSKLSTLIGKLTTSRITGVLTGLGVTAVIQSSSATTVMVVGFVNSGVMSLKQAINVIMGANVGTTVTAWLLSLTGIDSNHFFVAMLKPANFTPILALIGIIPLLSGKSESKKDVGTILLGFATLMFGMETMSAAVSELRNVPEFQELMLAFSNPVLGVAVGALLTAIIQSSSASVGILQALSATGQVTVGASIPIILGQNIGTCATALISSVGTGKNARRAAVVHLSFNIIGCALWLSVFTAANRLFSFAFVSAPASAFTIAVVHSIFNLACTACLLPAADLLEKLAYRIIPEGSKTENAETILDERLLATPAFAIDRCRAMSIEMASAAQKSLAVSLEALSGYRSEQSEAVRACEDKTDRYEDQLGSYLVKLSSKPLSTKDSAEVTMILHMIGDFERIADHAVNIIESVEEMQKKDCVFSKAAEKELSVFTAAVCEIVERTFSAYTHNDLSLARRIEPLEQVIDELKDALRSRHILRLQAGECSLGTGFVLTDLLTNLERVADHCSNIAGCMIEMQHGDLDLHEYLSGRMLSSEDFQQEYRAMQNRFALD